MSPHSISLLTLLLFASPAFAARAWYVDSSQAGGDGSVSAPFASLADAEKASASGDTIIVVPGAARYGAIALKAGQSLAGKAGYAATSRPVLESISIADGPVHVEGVAVAKVIVEGGRGDVVFDGVAIESSDGTAITVHGHEGAVTFRGGSVKVTSSSRDAVVLRDAPSVVTFADPITISTTGVRALLASKVTKLVVAAGSVLESKNAPLAELRDVELDVDFARLTAAGQGIDAAVILEHTRGRFTANGGEIRGAKKRGIEIRDASNVTLRKMTFNGTPADNGVAAAVCADDLLLRDNTLCGAAILLQNAAGVVLEDVRIEDSRQLGISGRDVHDATFRRVTISGAGDELNEHALVFRNLYGDVIFTECAVTRFASRGLYVLNDSGTSAISIEKSRFGESTATLGQQGLLIAADQSATMKLRVRESTFSRIPAMAIYVLADGKSVVDADIAGNQFDRTGGAVNLLADEQGRFTFAVDHNRVTDSAAPVAINAGESSQTSTASMSGTISGNILSGGGISVLAAGTGKIAANVHGNQITKVPATAILAHAMKRARLDVAITSNALGAAAAATFPAIRVQAGSLPADVARVCARIGGGGALSNKITGAWDSRGAVQLVNRTASRLMLPALEGSGEAAVQSWIAKRNGGATARIMLASPPSETAITSGDECAVPPVR